MKKLKLRAMELGAKEVLTRAQLMNVLGGILPGKCTVTQTCAHGSVSCQGAGSSCYFVTNATGQSGVQCDSDPGVFCSTQAPPA